MKLVKDELEKSKEYDFEMICDNNVALCRKNVALVEAMIKYNSSYKNIYGRDAKTYSKIKELKCKVDKDNVNEILNMINNQNSTRASKTEILELSNRIVNFDKNNGLIKFLKNPDKKYSLITDLSAQIQTDRNKNGRTNFSLATKICQTLCFVINEYNESQDNFMKFDTVLRKNLPRYLKIYKLSINEILNNDEYINFMNKFKVNENNIEFKFIEFLYDASRYSLYIRTIEKLIEATGEKISKNGLDHLIWYTNK